MSNQREESKQDWKGRMSIESINSGSLQRIADAAAGAAAGSAAGAAWAAAGAAAHREMCARIREIIHVKEFRKVAIL